MVVNHRGWRVVRRALGATLVFLAAIPAQAELWRSPLHTLTYVQIEKRLRDPLLDAERTAELPPAEVFEPLPAAVLERAGHDAEDYDGFLAAYLPPGEAAALVAEAQAAGLVALHGLDRRVELPWHAFEAGDAAARTPREFGGLLLPAPVPRLYLLQWAYPVRESWLAALAPCGVEVVAFFQQRTSLVEAAGLDAILACSVTSRLSWIDAYRVTDRLAPELLGADAPLGFRGQFLPGTDLAAKAAALPAVVVAGEPEEDPDLPLALLGMQAGAAELLAFAANDPDLLSLGYQGELAPSDERQGQIVAGNHNGTAPTGPGYKTWLTARGLLTPANQQVVGIIDVGYDDGGGPTPAVDHHPDLENPERLVAPVHFYTGPTGHDVLGHGTMVAGIIAGDGAAGLGTGSKDPENYLYGTGIAPAAKLVVSKQSGAPLLTRLTEGLNHCRTSATGADRALIVNNSYNLQKLVRGIVLADNEYDEFAMHFDLKVVDGSTLAGQQPTTIVFSAGNFAYDYATGTIRRDSVASPATAKNVIAVGATASYRPAPSPPLDCQQNPNGSRPPNQDAVHIARLGSFSGRGQAFLPSGTARLHTTRIKPDLVAPGVRVFSTVPFNHDGYTTPVGCTKFYPAGSFYTYGTGTSFAAPVVSGIAALARKWFLDRGTDPSPSLVKAALIATADSLGAFLSNDHRPSSNSGWGRVNLNRLTDARARFYVKDNQVLAVSTGQQRSWTRTVDNPGFDTLIVLAWSDPPADAIGSSQAPLKNNLGLVVEEVGSTRFWRGNNFRENVLGDDNGYSHRFTTPAGILVDSINNVEAIFIPGGTLPVGQKLTIKVNGESVTAGSQKFSVYAYNVRAAQ